MGDGPLSCLTDREVLALLVGRHRRKGADPDDWSHSLVELAATHPDDLAYRLQLSPRGARIIRATLECHRRLLA